MGKVKYAIFIVFVFFVATINVHAASASLSRSNNNITPGNQIKITSTISSNSPIFFIEGSLTCNGAGVDKSLDLKFETMDNNKKSDSKSLTITPTSVGEVVCKISGRVIDASSSNWNSVSSSITVNVVKPRDKSNNNDLKSLSVEGYELSPSFDKDTLEYTVSLDSNVEKIKIHANEEDRYASLEGIGEKEVQEGSNVFEIKVTSETGKTKIYKINAIVEDSNPIIKKVDGKSYTVVKRTSSLPQPITNSFEEDDMFIATTVKISDVEIPAFYYEKTKTTLIGLADEQGNIDLYQYDLENDSCSRFDTLISQSRIVVFEENETTNEYFTKTVVKIGDKEYHAYQCNVNKDYILIYGMDLQSGHKNWYLYNIKEESLQLYMDDIIHHINDLNAKTLEEYKMVILGMAGLSLMLLLIVIILMITKSKLKRKMIKIINMKREEAKKESEKNSKKESVDNKKNKK